MPRSDERLPVIERLAERGVAVHGQGRVRHPGAAGIAVHPGQRLRAAGDRNPARTIDLAIEGAGGSGDDQVVRAEAHLARKDKPGALRRFDEAIALLDKQAPLRFNLVARVASIRAAP